MKVLIIAAIALSAGFAGLSGSDTLAQAPVVYDDASGTDGSCTASGPPSDQVVVCSDMRPGSGRAVSEDGVNPAPAPAEAPPPAEPAPVTEAAPENSEMAVASATDQDADNAPDESEPGLGLDPTNPDTDADGVADGDEPNIYGTDPLSVDTDGDGLGDGEELFATHTDPLIPDNAGSQGGS